MFANIIYFDIYMIIFKHVMCKCHLYSNCKYMLCDEWCYIVCIFCLYTVCNIIDGSTNWKYIIIWSNYYDNVYV